MNFVWVDMEMTGLNPDSDRVIEIAVVVTDAELDVIAEGPVLALHQEESILLAMDNWNTATHGRSGLTDRVRASTLDEEVASDQLLAFLAPLVPRGQ
ncbi:MAG: oligoribonuclease, partial [Telluria sp.]